MSLPTDTPAHDELARVERELQQAEAQLVDSMIGLRRMQQEAERNEDFDPSDLATAGGRTNILIDYIVELRERVVRLRVEIGEPAK
jgi:hypothetical protein